MARPIRLIVDKPLIPPIRLITTNSVRVTRIPMTAARNTPDQPQSYNLALSSNQLKGILNNDRRVLEKTLPDRLRARTSSTNKDLVHEKYVAMEKIFDDANSLRKNNETGNENQTVDEYAAAWHSFGTVWGSADKQSQRRFDQRVTQNIDNANDSTTIKVKFSLDGKKIAWANKVEATQKTPETIVITETGSALRKPSSRIYNLATVDENVNTSVKMYPVNLQCSVMSAKFKLWRNLFSK